jgi:hypothetical protein
LKAYAIEVYSVMQASKRKNVLAIAASTRHVSTNHYLLQKTPLSCLETGKTRLPDLPCLKCINESKNASILFKVPGRFYTKHK